MTQKEKAIECLYELDVAPFFIEKFANEGKVYVFENFVGYKVERFVDLEVKIKEYERERNCIVYAVTHEVFSFGECFSFLNVPVYEEDWKYLVSGAASDLHRVMAYVWNKSQEHCSESGSVIIHSFIGGIARIG